MTIKEIEEASGMLRANIRYYELEGFLHPAREKNGYRNYTEEDLKILKKIKLLRTLHISLEEIKAMHEGEQELGKTLEEHLLQLTQRQRELEKSKYVCEKMQRDGATYEKLNTEQYLLVLKNCHPEITEKEEWIERDVPEPLQIPWLRIFARCFDYLFYFTFFICLVFLWHRTFGLERNTLVLGVAHAFFLNLLLAILLEPVMLHFFGTTPGKALLGLRVNYDLGGKLPMDMAWARSWRANLCMHDWKYRDYFREIRIYKAMDEGKVLHWDYMANTTLELKDEKLWRKAVFALATIGCVLVIAYDCQEMRMLPNRGAVTAEEFAENYNTLRDVVYNGGLHISEDGEWKSEFGYGEQSFTRTVDGESRQFVRGGYPEKIDIVEENGVVTQISFYYETTNPKEYLDDFKRFMIYFSYAFVEGEQNYNVFTYKNWEGLKEQILRLIKGSAFDKSIPVQTDYFEEFSGIVGGVELTCDIELQGYEEWKGVYVAKEGADTYYRVQFSARKVGK